jgi:hypothetical protein
MARIDDLADLFGQHIATPWQRTVAGAQRVILVTYDKELERVLRARKAEFETRARAAGVANRIRDVLSSALVSETSVVAVVGTGSLYGFTHVSEVLKHLERDVRGRLVVFFPGTLEQNNYRLLDARDGWNYMAVPISIHGAGGAA